VIGAGKAAAAMARVVESRWSSDVTGIVVTLAATHCHATVSK